MKTKSDFIDTVRLFEVIEERNYVGHRFHIFVFLWSPQLRAPLMSSVKVIWDQRAEENFLDGKEVFLRKYSMRNEVFKGVLK